MGRARRSTLNDVSHKGVSGVAVVQYLPPFLGFWIIKEDETHDGPRLNCGTFGGSACMV